MSNAAEVALKLRSVRLDGDDVARILQVGALQIETEAKKEAPVRTGTLRRDIRTEVKVEGLDGRARIGNTTAVPYAVHQEYGTSKMPGKAYLRGALRTKGPEAAKDMAEAAKRIIRAKARAL